MPTQREQTDPGAARTVRDGVGDATDLRRPGAILLVSCYELGHQPHGITLPKAFLERAGFAPSVMDLAVGSFETAKVDRARVVVISVPMHTALRLGESVARRARELKPDCHVSFHGHYAVLHAQHLLDEKLADSVLGGESEQRLVELLQSLECGPGQLAPAIGTAGTTVLQTLDFAVPSRTALPAPERYAHLVRGDTHVVAGYTEASRGCLHRCRHCPLPAVYDGRLFIVPRDVVLADIRNQVRAGARHITFGDADFLNGPAHALRVARAIHDEFPDITFDYTAKIEHVLRHAQAVHQLGQLGAIFMVSAVEVLSDRILEILDKNHTRRDIDEALHITSEAGTPMRPSLMPFTPWTTPQDLVDLLDWVESEDLVDAVDPVHYSIRLLVPPGSLLLQHPEMHPHLGTFDREHLTYRWRHPDARMDTLQQELVQLVEASVSRGDDPAATFALVHQQVETSLQMPKTRRRGATHEEPRRRRQRPPRLTESWFC